MPALLFIPLDDRPVTRDAVLDLAAVLGIPVHTPEGSLLGTRDRGADVHALWSWIDRQVEGSEAPAACIASIEMLCFGGLVASRRSERHWRNVLPWLDRVYGLAARMPTYISAVIPRTPVSGGTHEDPPYWETHGDALRTYSTAADEFAWMGGAAAAERVADALQRLPAGILEAVLQHRRRHLLLNAELLIAAGRGSIRALLIGQDDTTAAGLSRLDREGLERLARVLGAANARLTTGADELGAVMFARWLNESRGTSPAIRIVYTFPEARDRVPAYESQPLAETVREHVEAAGCRVVTDGEDILLWVHNFEQERQGEALHQEEDGLTAEARAAVIRLLREVAREERVAAVADVRYANGADRALVEILLHTRLAGGINGYAGWNTASNSVGSTVAQAIVAHHLRREPTDAGWEALRRLVIARLLDDWGYQAVVRPHLATVLRERGGDPVSLGDHEPFLQGQAEELLRGILLPLEACYRRPITVTRVAFPWHRLFEATVEFAVAPRDTSRDLVVLADFDPQWPALFAAEAERLSQALAGFDPRVEHVGSTAVSGLAAKPAVDILVGLVRDADLDRCIDPLQGSGYVYVPQYEDQLPERRLFARGPDGRAYHVHVVVRGGEFWQRHLLFRDYLRAHPDIAAEYERLKRDLAARYGADRRAYTEAKTGFIRSVEERARRRQTS